MDGHRFPGVGPETTRALITVLVGQHQERFQIPERQLRNHSKFCDAELTQRENEGSPDRTVRLSPVAPVYFGIWLQWLDTAKVFANDVDTDRPEHQFSYRDLVELYVLGQLLRDHDFQDAVTDSLQRRTDLFPQGQEHYPSAECVGDLYNRTGPGDPLRKLFVDQFASPSHAPKWTVEVLRTPPEIDEDLEQFATDLARKLGDSSWKRISWTGLEEYELHCKYHRHEGPDGICYREKSCNRRAS